MTHIVRLPKGWVSAEIRELGEIITGSTPPTKRSEFYDGPVPFVRPQELLGLPISGTETTLTEAGAQAGRVVPEDSVLVGCIGTLGKTGLTTVASAFNQQINAIVPTSSCIPKWLLYGVQSPGFRRQMVENASATTVAIINKGRFSLLMLDVAPLAEQERIVEAIESYLTRLDDAVASLERVQRNLNRYRASVLKAAVEGRLVPTEAELARQERREYESASELLERILTEREQRWIEDAAEKARAKAEDKARKAGKPWTHVDNVKTLEKERAKAAKKYKEPVAPDLSALGAQAGTSNLPGLPEGWCWTALEQLSYVTGGITKNSKRATLPLQVPYLRVANVYADELRLREIKRIGVEEDEYSRTMLETDDLLVVEGNGSIGQIGRVALWNGSISGCCHQNHLIKARLVLRKLARWVLLWLLSAAGRKQITHVASSTSGLHTLNISKVSSLPIPLPPQAEASRLILEIEQLLSLANNSARFLKNSTARSSRLRQSILKWAFEGKLVEQDPSDKSASVLLERIKAEREAMQPRNKRRTNRQRKKAPAKHDGQLDLLEGSNT